MTNSAETPKFVMHGAREAIAGGMSHISKHVADIEQAVFSNPGYAFDLSKSLIESVCKNIIVEREKIYDKDDDLPKLFKSASQLLPLLPAEIASNTSARQSLFQTLGGMTATVRGVCELRNSFGYVSHGSESSRDFMESAQALLAAESADAVIGFLFRVHAQTGATKSKTIVEYSSNQQFNEGIDEQCDPIQILNLGPYRPSEVLFSIDQEAYKTLLSEHAGIDLAEHAIDSNENEATS